MFPSKKKAKIKKFEKAQELKGKLQKQEEQKLMHSVMDADKEKIEKGKLLKEALNQSVGTFNPDLMFDKFVNNYSLAKNLYGEKLIRLITGYSPDYVKKNVNIPEFQRELKKKIEENVEGLRNEGLIGKDNSILGKGMFLASLIMYVEELDNLIARGTLGEVEHKKNFLYGDKQYTKMYKKGDRYRDIALKKSLKMAIRRGHLDLDEKDLQVYEKKSKGQISLVYAIDASGSMKGDKIDVAKKAGIALAFKAIDKKDSVGLITFGTEVESKIEPTVDFIRLLLEITKIKASKETNITQTIEESVLLFPKGDITKHLILITDAVPTIGKKPKEEVLEAVSKARSAGITISLVGIKLDKEGEELAKDIVLIGEGKLYSCKNLKNVDKVILEDYYSVM